MTCHLGLACFFLPTPSAYIYAEAMSTVQSVPPSVPATMPHHADLSSDALETLLVSAIRMLFPEMYKRRRALLDASAWHDMSETSEVCIFNVPCRYQETSDINERALVFDSMASDWRSHSDPMKFALFCSFVPRFSGTIKPSSVVKAAGGRTCACF